MGNNFEIMMQIVNEVFHYDTDPHQLQVDEAVVEQLTALHPATCIELNDENGPIFWLILIPTSLATMQLFLKGEISEQTLYNYALTEKVYEALYLCSIALHPNYRNKGMATLETKQAILQLKSSWPINCLYYWPLSTEGDQLAQKLALEMGLPIYKKSEQKEGL